METAKRRTWADLIVLIVALWTVAQAIWGATLFPQRSQDTGASSNYILSLIGGGLALLGSWIAQRRVPLGRALVAFAGAFLLIGPFTYQRMASLPTTFAVLSGLLLWVAAKFIGPVPPPAGKMSGVVG